MSHEVAEDTSSRALGVFNLTCLGLNCVIGSAIFLVPGSLAADWGPWAPVGFLVGGLLILPIALCFAEMSRGETQTGGAYLYAHRAFGPEVGFLVGWVIWLSGLIGGASVAVGFANLACSFFQIGGWETEVACGLLSLFALINLSGTRRGALSNDLLATTKLVPLVLFVLWALVHVGPAAMVVPPTPASWSPALGSGLLAVLYAFSGFEEVPLPAGDVREPEKTVGRSLFMVLLISTVFYCLIQGGVSGLGLAGSKAPLSEATRGVFFLGTAVALAGLLSGLSVNASIAFTSPRSLWALSRAGWLPQWLAVQDPQRLVPSRCILVNLFLALLLAGSGTFQTLMQLSVLASLVQHLATVLACWKGRSFSLRPSVPLLAVLVCLGLLTACSREDVIGLGEALLSGWILSRLYRFATRKS